MAYKYTLPMQVLLSFTYPCMQLQV